MPEYIDVESGQTSSFISGTDFIMRVYAGGSAFRNDFAGDKFEFGTMEDIATAKDVAKERIFWSKDVFSDVGANALTNFQGFASVKLFGFEAEWNDANAYVTKWLTWNGETYDKSDAKISDSSVRFLLTSTVDGTSSKMTVSLLA